MKALFTAFPAYGHVIPLLPLIRAAQQAGDRVLVAVDAGLHHLIPDARTVHLGPDTAELLAENLRVTDGDAGAFRSDQAEDQLDSMVRLFTATRVARSLDALNVLVDQEQPDVIVTEMWDYTAPIAAARRGIPWVPVAHSPTTPLDDVLADAMRRTAAAHEVTVSPPLVTVQQWPSWLQPGPLPDVPRLELGPGSRAAAFTDHRTPRVLVTLGTVVDDQALLDEAVEAARAAGAEVVATDGINGHHRADEPGVTRTPFAPMNELLHGIDAVVAAGGSGTTLAALARGLPIAFIPRIANQPLVAQLIAAQGAGVVVDTDQDLQTAITRVLQDPSYRQAAHRIADRLATEPSAIEVWAAVDDALGDRSR